MTAAIIGGGVIGGGWLARFVLNGWNVRVFDPDPEAERKINAVLDQARHALPMLYETSLPVEGSVTYCSHIGETVTGVDPLPACRRQSGRLYRPSYRRKPR